MYDNMSEERAWRLYDAEDEGLIEEQAECLDFEIELDDGQAVIEALMLNGFNR